MDTFKVVLVHPDGSTRRFARQKKTGELAITANILSNKSYSFASFESVEQAKAEAEKYIARISEFLPKFPKYELLVDKIND